MDRVDAPFGQRLIWRIEALGFELIRLLLRLPPVDVASAFGGRLLQVFGPLTSVHKTVMRNLRLAFPDMGEAERARIAHAQWDNVGRYFVEFAMMDRLTPATGRVEVRQRCSRKSGR